MFDQVADLNRILDQVIDACRAVGREEVMPRYLQVAHERQVDGGLLTEASWILRRMGENMGLAINPGDELGFDFDADMVAMLCAVLPEESQ